MFVLFKLQGNYTILSLRLIFGRPEKESTGHDFLKEIAAAIREANKDRLPSSPDNQIV